MVGLWTIQLLVQVRRHSVQSTLARRGYDNHNRHNKSQRGNGTGVWMTSCPEAMGWEFGYFEKQSVGDKMPNWEPAALGPQWSTVGQPSQDEKEVLLGQYSSLSPSLAHLSHTTNINPFENKVWELYFYKEVCSFVHWNSSLLLTMFPLIFVCVCGYTTIL